MYLAVLLLACSIQLLCAGTAQLPLADSDFVIVTSTMSPRYPLVKAARPSRKGIRTFIVTNDSTHRHLGSDAHLETYAYFADDSKQSRTWRGSQPGNTRWAYSPFLAHLEYRDSYKWMLVGDDNTLWHIPGLKKLLQDYDYTVPYAITDNLWSKGKHPNTDAPRCLPCHFDVSTIDEATKASISFMPQPGCPFCSMDIACKQHKADLSHQGVRAMKYAPRAPTKVDRDMMKSAGRWRPRNPCGLQVIGHGGSGLVLSVGLMRYININSTLAFINTLRGCSGGDCLLSRALSWYNRIGFTDPGVALTMRDVNYTRNGVFIDPSSQRDLYLALQEAGQRVMTKDGCDEHCKWVIRNAVSQHVRVFRRQPITLEDLMDQYTREAESYERALRYVGKGS